MLLPRIEQDTKFKELVGKIREDRAIMGEDGANVPMILHEIIENETYKKDYEVITSYFQNHPVPYETVITALKTIADSDIFA